MSDAPQADVPFPSSGEDWSLLRWWRQHPRRGWLWTEVAIGHLGPGAWPNPRSHRRIDAVHIPGHPVRKVRRWDNDIEAFREAVSGAEVEIVEAKRELNFSVIGQCIAGIDMFTRAYPAHGLVRPVAVVRGPLDPALLWVCRRRGIDIDTMPERDLDVLRSKGPGLLEEESG